MLLNYNYLKITEDTEFIANSSFNKMIIDGYTYRLFNTSMIHINSNEYLCIIRYGHTYETSLIPGNSKECIPKYSDRADDNFWWNSWSNVFMNLSSLNFFGIYNSKTTQLKEITIDYNGYKFDDTDIRICKIKNTIYIYKTNLSTFIECEYNMANYTLTLLNFTNYTISLKRQPYVNCGQNYAPFDIITIDGNSTLLYLDWFYGDYCLIRYSAKAEDTFKHNGVQMHLYNHINAIKINFTKKSMGFYGEGSYNSQKSEDKKKYGNFYGMTPGFSFTTPHIEIEDDVKKCWIGVGHTKIRNPAERYPYIEGSKIEQFRTNLHKQMFEKYGDKYKLHMGSSNPPDCMGYIYLMYFYKLIHNGDDDYDMFISDSYLPLDLSDETKDDYKFSLVFPMGIVKQNINGHDVLKVSCGEGDYNSIILDFDYETVMKSIKYDVKTFDITNYEYYLLLYKNGISVQTTLCKDDKSITDVNDKLNGTHPISKIIELTTNISSSQEPFMRKYIKYKTKYLQLKYDL